MVKWEIPQRSITCMVEMVLEFLILEDIWKFLLRSVYDTLPSPANIQQWGQAPACKLCVKRGIMTYNISGCSVALTQGRYRWRHDNVLRDMVTKIEKERTRKRTAAKAQASILAKRVHDQRTRKGNISFGQWRTLGA